MSKFIDLAGQKFGRLLVIENVGKNKWKNRQWLCQCDCGKKSVVTTSNLNSGTTISCGCFNREKSTIHGHYKNNKESPTYTSWNHMMDRCKNPKHLHYHRYGGRGITVCKRWIKFKNFLEDMGERPEGLTLDRRNNDRGYYPKNCRWATNIQQNRNRRNNVLITFNNRTKCLPDWAEEFGIDCERLRQRISVLNWSIEKALTTPVAKRRRRK